jgi:DHA1 family bicyclomycin/chloramphenicol resistance-like MFS transporter
VVALVFAWMLLHETHHHRHVSTGPLAMLRGFPILLRDRAFNGYALNVSFTTAVFFSFLAGAPYIMVELMGRPSSDYGNYFVLIAFCYMFGNFCSGRLATRMGPERMVLTGSLLAVAGTALLSTLAFSMEMTPMALFGPVMLIGLGNGLTMPSATAAAISRRPDLAGTASGLLGFTQMMVGALITLLVGWLQDDTVYPMVAVMTVSAVIAFLGCLLARTPLLEERSVRPAAEAD